MKYLFTDFAILKLFEYETISLQTTFCFHKQVSLEILHFVFQVFIILNTTLNNIYFYYQNSLRLPVLTSSGNLEFSIRASDICIIF